MLGILGDCWAPGRPMEIFNPATDGAVVLFARLGIRLKSDVVCEISGECR